MFGSPEVTPGGRALKFYSSIRLDIRRIETLKEGVEAVGNRVRVKVVKNKVAPPFKQAEFDIIYGSGINWEGTVLDSALERKIVQKSGSYFSFGEERLGQGRHNAAAFLREHPDVSDAIVAPHPGRGSGPSRSSPRASCPRQAPRTRRRRARRSRRPTRTMAPTVTALRARRGGRVLVQIDGHDWRELPADVVVRARFTPEPSSTGRGCARSPANGAAPRRLQRRAASCAPRPPRPRARRSARAAGDRAADRATALSTLEGAGSSTTSASRATARSRSRVAASATPPSATTSRSTASSRSWSTRPSQALEPEAARAERIVASRGRSPATARFLARKGFGEDAVESAAARGARMKRASSSFFLHRAHFRIESKTDTDDPEHDRDSSQRRRPS